MQPVRFDYGSLHAGGAGVLPPQTEGVDFLLLDGGPVVAPDQEGPELILEEAFDRLGPRFFLDPGLNVLASLAGREPRSSARSIAQRLVKTSNFDLPISVVRGHNLLGGLEEFMREHPLAHAVTGERFADLLDPTVAAVACLGRKPTVAALSQDARVVLVGHESPGDMAAAAGRFWFGSQASKHPIEDAASQAGLSLSAMHQIARRKATLDDPFYTSHVGPLLLNQSGELDDSGVEPGPASLSQSPWPGETIVRDPGVSAVTILHRKTFVTDAVLYLRESGVLNELYRDLTDSNAWSRSLPNVSVWPSDDDTDEFLVRATLRHPERDHVARAALLLRQIVGPLAEEGVAFLTAPMVHATYETWPTSLPADCLEWSIDTRTAREWLD